MLSYPRSLAVLLVPLLFSVSSCMHVPSVESDCPFGVYSDGKNKLVLSDGTRGDGPVQTAYTFIDGKRGVLGGKGSSLQCSSGMLATSDEIIYRPQSLSERNIAFESNGITLTGRLIVPSRGPNETKPLAVFVHGSERTPTVGHSRYPWILAAQGVSVFVYDKRGTGKSEGTYTQDFQILGDDAAAAFRTASKLAGHTHDRIGFFGGSQGGWVAPLAATKVPADFMVIGFGLILSPAEEDAEQVFEEMRRSGFRPDDIAKAKNITDATAEIVASHFSTGIDKLIALKGTYQHEDWLTQIEGEYTGALIRASEQDLRSGRVPGFEDDNVDWRYNAAAVIRSLSIPQLWIIAEDDRAAPGQLTYTRLRSMQSNGMPITTAVFPDTDHGIIEFVENPDGSRRYTDFAKGYFRLVADTMKGIFHDPYGTAQITKADPETSSQNSTTAINGRMKIPRTRTLSAAAFKRPSQRRFGAG